MARSYLYSTYLLATTLILALTHTVPCALAAPTTRTSHALVKRQNAPFDGPQTIQTHNVIAVSGGSVVEDCTVLFEPIVVNGLNLVKETRRCTDVFVPEGQPLPPPPPPPTNTDTGAPPPPPAQTDSAPPTGTDPGTTSAPETTTPPGDAGNPGGASDTTTVTDPNTPPAPSDTIPGLPETTSAPGSPAGPDPAPTNGPAGPSGSDPVIVLGPTDVPAGSATTTAQGQQADPSASGVNIPGKKLEVLPIGLGVFAGISVIALIVVGLVTYERTKYRKAFRQRRLAAAGAEMGYGGMSERR